MAYFAYTRPDSLASAMDTATTSMNLVDGTSLPDPALPGVGPYTVIVGYGTSREEVCTVTAKPSSSILTVIRAEDSTLSTAKNQGDIVVHGVSARDFNAMANKLDRAGGVPGGVMTGPLTLSGDPTEPLHAASRQYVDTLTDALTVSVGTKLTRALFVISASTTAAAVLHTDYVYLCTTPLTLGLPTPELVTGQMYTVKNMSTGSVTVAAQVDGPSNFVLDVQYQSVDLISTGSNWVIV